MAWSSTVGCCIRILFFILAFICVLSEGRRRRSSKECALFQAQSEEVYVRGDGEYVALEDRYDAGGEVAVEFSVMTSDHDNSGVLFALSDVDQFNFRLKVMGANANLQYILIEILRSSVMLTVKGVGPDHSKSLMVSCAYPEPYHIGDGEWHVIKAWRSPGYWHLSVDGVAAYEPIQTHAFNSTNVHITQGYAYLGGRPGYSDKQFLGIIKDVKINGQAVHLSDQTTTSHCEVVRCESKHFQHFKDWMMSNPVLPEEYNPWCGTPRHYPPPDNAYRPPDNMY